MSEDFKLSSYYYNLPQELIAARPANPRDHSRLLVYNFKEDKIIHDHFYNLGSYLPANSLLVLNQTKVFPCRLLGNKETGGRVEIFILSLVEQEGGYPVLIKSRGKKKIGDHYLFLDGVLSAEIKSIYHDGTFGVSFSEKNLIALLQKHALVPIPPYIRGGESDEQDKSDYQTLFAKEEGSVAAPTAGLHFTDRVFKSLDDKNINRAFVTLHVGMGTFSPVKSDDIREHQMHSEYYKVLPQDVEKISKATFRIAVGTTSLRALESSYSGSEFDFPQEGKNTNIFLHPGKDIKSIDALITNFHLPESSLLMLVSCLIGREKTLSIYEEAIKEKYRFFSYGDAMLILR